MSTTVSTDRMLRALAGVAPELIWSMGVDNLRQRIANANGEVTNRDSQAKAKKRGKAKGYTLGTLLRQCRTASVPTLVYWRTKTRKRECRLFGRDLSAAITFAQSVNGVVYSFAPLHVVTGGWKPVVKEVGQVYPTPTPKAKRAKYRKGDSLTPTAKEQAKAKAKAKAKVKAKAEAKTKTKTETKVYDVTNGLQVVPMSESFDRMLFGFRCATPCPDQPKVESREVSVLVNRDEYAKLVANDVATQEAYLTALEDRP